MFQLACSYVLSEVPLPAPELEGLRAYWERLRSDALPSLRDVDPRRVQVIPGRVHLVQVEGPRRFRFLHYGARVTNPDARDMTGLTTDDYDDRAFAVVVTDHYAEAVMARVPVCRALRAIWNGKTYDYIRLVAPFCLDDEDVACFLLIATHRIAVPAELDRVPAHERPETLRAGVERTRRLAREFVNDPAHVALEGLAAAAALHFAEVTAAVAGPR